MTKKLCVDSKMSDTQISDLLVSSFRGLLGVPVFADQTHE